MRLYKQSLATTGGVEDAVDENYFRWLERGAHAAQA